MSPPDDALRCYAEALRIARVIGYRLIEAGTHAYTGKLRLFQSDWDGAVKEFEQAMDIADDIG